jgi:uncharacterized membrane protein YsdA (DUF1294 family)
MPSSPSQDSTAFIVYLAAVNLLAFVAFTLDFLRYSRTGRDSLISVALSVFAAVGGGAGMLAAFLVWDRKVVKDNVAWRYIAIIGIIVWTMISVAALGLVTLDIRRVFAPLDRTLAWILGIYFAVINVATFVAFAHDKRLAVEHRFRTREFVLLGLALLGGSLGGMLAMRAMRHKTRVWYFRWGLPAMLILNVATVVFLRAAGAF